MSRYLSLKNENASIFINIHIFINYNIIHYIILSVINHSYFVKNNYLKLTKIRYLGIMFVIYFYDL